MLSDLAAIFNAENCCLFIITSHEFVFTFTVSRSRYCPTADSWLKVSYSDDAGVTVEVEGVPSVF